MSEIDERNVRYLSVTVNKWISDTFNISVTDKQYEKLKSAIGNTYQEEQKPKLGIHEIRIRKTKTLPNDLQEEVMDKVSALSKGFNYQGYCKIIYVGDIAPAIDRVEPIEGTILDEYKRITDRIKEAKND